MHYPKLIYLFIHKYRVHRVQLTPMDPLRIDSFGTGQNAYQVGHLLCMNWVQPPWPVMTSFDP